MNALARAALALVAPALAAGCIDGSVSDLPTDVTSPRVATMRVDPDALTLSPGRSLRLSVQARDPMGNELLQPAVLWSSSDTSVAIVSSSGAVTAVSLGVATVTAATGSVEAAATVAVVAEPPRILVDASRDGGVWWFPQWQGSGGFDPAQPHQGQALADHLRTLGYAVDELPRPTAITSALLSQYRVVIRANAFDPYAAAEVEAYREYVAGGGRILLLGDHMLHPPPDSLALAFGIAFAGITRGDNQLGTFAAHDISHDVGSLGYGVGSAIVAWPESATLVGWLSQQSYADLDRNGVQDPGEPSAPAVLGAMAYGEGRIVFCGDTNLWEWVPQPLVGNVLAWLVGP